MAANTDIDISRWVSERLTNYDLMIDRDLGYRTRQGSVEFVIRCLANPTCDGSADVLAAIEERRQEVGA